MTDPSLSNVASLNRRPKKVPRSAMPARQLSMKSFICSPLEDKNNTSKASSLSLDARAIGDTADAATSDDDLAVLEGQTWKKISPGPRRNEQPANTFKTLASRHLTQTECMQNVEAYLTETSSQLRDHKPGIVRDNGLIHTSSQGSDCAHAVISQPAGDSTPAALKDTGPPVVNHLNYAGRNFQHDSTGTNSLRDLPEEDNHVLAPDNSSLLATQRLEPISLHRFANENRRQGMDVAAKTKLSQCARKWTTNKEKKQPSIVRRLAQEVSKESRLRNGAMTWLSGMDLPAQSETVVRTNSAQPENARVTNTFVNPWSTKQVDMPSTKRRKIGHDNTFREQFIQPGYHRTTGGKSYNPRVVKKCLEELRQIEEHEEDDANETTSIVDDREESPFNDPDYVHWEYQVWRKTWGTSETEDEAYWAVCGDDSFWTTLPEANAAAGREILRRRNGFGLCPAVIRWQYHVDEHGMAHYMASTLEGHTRVKVDRFLRNATHGKKPISKLGWLKRYVYDVIQKTTETNYGATNSDPQDTIDELFEETTAEEPEHIEKTSQQVIDGPYTILDQANREAAEVVLSMTQSKTARYDDFYAQKEREKSMAERLSRLETENELFSERIELKAEKKVVEIWVEKRELKGPRNI